MGPVFADLPRSHLGLGPRSLRADHAKVLSLTVSHVVIEMDARAACSETSVKDAAVTPVDGLADEVGNPPSEAVEIAVVTNGSLEAVVLESTGPEIHQNTQTTNQNHVKIPHKTYFGVVLGGFGVLGILGPRWFQQAVAADVAAETEEGRAPSSERSTQYSSDSSMCEDRKRALRLSGGGNFLNTLLSNAPHKFLFETANHKTKTSNT